MATIIFMNISNPLELVTSHLCQDKVRQANKLMNKVHGANFNPRYLSNQTNESLDAIIEELTNCLNNKK